MQICRRSQADVRGTAFGLQALDQDRLAVSNPSPCQDAYGPGPLSFAPSSRKQAALDGFFFVANSFPVPAY